MVFIGGNVTLAGDPSPAATQGRLQAFGRGYFPEAQSVAGEGNGLHDAHVTMLYHKKGPADENFLHVTREMAVTSQRFTGEVNGIRLAGKDERLIIITFKAPEFQEYVDELWQWVEFSTGETPEMHKFHEYYKGINPHVTIAEFESRLEARRARDRIVGTPDQWFFGQEVTLSGFAVVD